MPTVDDGPRKAAGSTKGDTTRPTTLGAAARQSVAPSALGRAWIRPALGLTVAGALALGVVVWRQAGRADGSTGASNARPAVATVPTVPTPAAATSTAPVATATPAPAASGVTFAITSEPTGADVFDAPDGVRLGETPFSRAFARHDGDTHFVIRRRGYRDEQVTMQADVGGSRHVVLRPLDRRKHSTVDPGKGATQAAPEHTPATLAKHADKPLKDGALNPYAP